MYSTLKGAKGSAKSLKTAFQNSGILYPLNRCQTAIARAGGYADWHQLNQALGTAASLPLDPQTFRDRLIAALPRPCHAPARAWLDKEPLPTAETDGETPPRWYRDASPYWFASMGLHRGHTALIRPGSGTGQKLRESLVLGLLINSHGGAAAFPLLEAETLAMVYFGDLRTLFRTDVDHPRFDTEFARLIEAEILDWQPDDRGSGVLRVLPPEGLLQDRVEDLAVARVFEWVEGGEEFLEAFRDALHRALAILGVNDVGKIVDAILAQGREGFTSPSGPILDVLSDLADRGELQSFARAFDMFAKIVPASAEFVRAALPATRSQGFRGRGRAVERHAPA